MISSLWTLFVLAIPISSAKPAATRWTARAAGSAVVERAGAQEAREPLVAPVIPERTRDTLVDVGGYRLHFRITVGRTDIPVVVLDAGGGLDADEWQSLQPQLARVTGATIVSYDRAGFGSSDLPKTDFDFRREVAGLHAGLTALGLADHVVLVGHSYAGFTLQLYTGMFASTVQGLLFVDPNSPSFMLAMGGASGLNNLAGQHLPFDTAGTLTKVQAATAHQMRSLDTTVAEVAAAPLPATVPVIVLTAGRQWWPVPRQNRAFRASHELLANSVDDGTLIVAEHSAHMIPESEPLLIVMCVQTLLKKHRV